MPDTYLPTSLPTLVHVASNANEGRAITVALAGGGYVVAWINDLKDGSGKGMFAQRYDELGLKVGAEFALNTTTQGDQQTLSLAQSGTGFVAVWESFGQDGSRFGVVMQRFSALGTKLGPEVLVNSTTLNNQITPSVGVTGDGTIVVTWLQFDAAADDDVIIGQRFSASGLRLGDEFQIAVGADLTYVQVSPYSTIEKTVASTDIVDLDNGGFGVIYRSYGQVPGQSSSFGSRLFLQKYAADGTADGGPQFLTTIAGSNTFGRPSHMVVELEGGGFALIVLGTMGSSNDSGVSMMVVDGAGVVTQPRIEVLSSTDTFQGGNATFRPWIFNTPDLAVDQLSDGSIMVAFLSIGTVNRYDDQGVYLGSDDYTAIMAQQFDLSGVALNPPTYLTPERLSADWPRWLSLVGLEGGGFGLAWDQFGEDTPDSRAVVSLTALAIGQGTTGDDTLVGTAGFDLLDGLSGNDSMSGLGDRDLLEGNLGDDTIDGGAGDDVIYGGAGNDVLLGFGGDDAVDGGAGNDTVRGDDLGNDILRGGEGQDTLLFLGTRPVVVNLLQTTPQQTGVGTDAISGFENIVSSQGNDSLRGNAADNSLTGMLGNDSLSGEDGNDSLFGNAGNDDLTGGIGDDLLDGGNGFDRAIFQGSAAITVSLALTTAQNTGQGSDILRGIEGVVGGTGADRLTGNGQVNSLNGRDGDDLLNGGSGDDSLYAGPGSDVLIGGLGADLLVASADGLRDVFIFASADHSGLGVLADRIQAFETGIDRIDLRAMDADPGLAGNQHFVWSAVAAAGALWTRVSGSDLVLEGDVTGDAVADFAIVLMGRSALAAGDVLL